MGWTFPWASSFGSDFNYDFSVGFTEEQQFDEGIDYNYQHEKPLPATAAEKPGAAIPSRTTPDGATLFAGMTGTDVGTYTRERPGMSAFILEDGAVYPHLFRLFARTRRPLGHVPVARPRAEGPQRDERLVSPARRVRKVTTCGS
jgi:predicted dithiol-disulfide oxidoreductase (DUF899 family)